MKSLPQLTPYQWNILFAVNKTLYILEPLNADLLELEALNIVKCVKGRVFRRPQAKELYELVARAAAVALDYQYVAVPDEGFKYALEKMFRESRKDVMR